MGDDGGFQPENLEFGSGSFKDFEDPQLKKAHIKASTKKTVEYKEADKMGILDVPDDDDGDMVREHFGPSKLDGDVEYLNKLAKQKSDEKQQARNARAAADAEFKNMREELEKQSADANVMKLNLEKPKEEKRKRGPAAVLKLKPKKPKEG
jgi:hypothetical protein